MTWATGVHMGGLIVALNEIQSVAGPESTARLQVMDPTEAVTLERSHSRQGVGRLRCRSRRNADWEENAALPSVADGCIRHCISNCILCSNDHRQGKCGSDRSDLFGARHDRQRGYRPHIALLGKSSRPIARTRYRDGHCLRKTRQRIGAGSLAIAVCHCRRASEGSLLPPSLNVTVARNRSASVGIAGDDCDGIGKVVPALPVWLLPEAGLIEGKSP